MNQIYHYPPDLLTLLVEAIPLLAPRKRDVILFFTGAGVPTSITADVSQRLRENASSINKYEIARSVLTRINDGGDPLLRARREVVRRVCEFEDFSACWPDDQLKARGLVAQVRQLVNTKDSFTRMNEERERERRERVEGERKRREAVAAQAARLEGAHRQVVQLFAVASPQRRGKLLEAALDEVFSASGVKLREAFELRDASGVVLEQVDGAVELDHEVYLVEAKWHTSPVGPEGISRHISRLLSRADARGVVISASGFTAAAVRTAADALNLRTVVLCDLAEVVSSLERREAIDALLRAKVRAAITDRNPYYQPLVDGHLGGS